MTRFHAMTYPRLYYTSQQSRDLKMTHFMMNFWKSLYQASTIFVLSFLLIETSFLKIVTISFTALIMTELLNIITMVDRINKWILGANAISIFLFAVTLVFFRKYLDLYPIDWAMFKVVILIVICCWVPFELIKLANKIFFPSVSDKIMLTAKRDVRTVELSQDTDLLHKQCRSSVEDL